MTDNEKPNSLDTSAGAVGETQPIQIGVLAQYVKDLSFENPNAPLTLQKVGEGKPQIDVSVNVNAKKLGDEQFEVDLQITAKAAQGGTAAFVVELVYSGIFGARNLPQEAVQPFLLIECPRLLFPFARRIIADATRDGGFPPLLLEPIDFAALYRHQMAKQQQAGAPQPEPANQTVN